MKYDFEKNMHDFIQKRESVENFLAVATEFLKGFVPDADEYKDEK